MCIAAVAWRAHPRLPLLVVGNRDEFLRRPSLPMHRWQDYPTLLGGRDAEGGGTWFGVGEDGRFALVTNVRDMSAPPVSAPSRGLLPMQFLTGRETPELFCRELALRQMEFAGFNLLVGDAHACWYCSNRAKISPTPLEQGIAVLSNASLGTNWPKTERLKEGLGSLLTIQNLELDACFALLASRQVADDAALPKTGVPLDVERRLSSIFVSLPGYGTRASSVLVITGEGTGYAAERSFGPEGEMTGERVLNLKQRD